MKITIKFRPTKKYPFGSVEEFLTDKRSSCARVEFKKVGAKAMCLCVTFLEMPINEELFLCFEQDESSDNSLERDYFDWLKEQVEYIELNEERFFDALMYLDLISGLDD